MIFEGRAGGYDPFVVDKDRLTIRAALAAQPPTIDATGDNYGVQLPASDVTISGLNVRDATVAGFFVTGDLAFVDVTGRVAHAIMDLCNEPDAMTHPDGMQIKVSRQELSRLVGCSREMAGRVLKVLEEQGLVTASGKTIVVYGARPNRNLP